MYGYNLVIDETNIFFTKQNPFQFHQLQRPQLPSPLKGLRRICGHRNSGRKWANFASLLQHKRRVQLWKVSIVQIGNVIVLCAYFFLLQIFSGRNLLSLFRGLL